MTADAKLPEAHLERARTDTRLTIIGELTNLLLRLTEDGVINQSRVAERLGVSRQAVSKLMSGPANNNWTIDKIGELLAAMEARISRIEMRPVKELSPPNEIHPWLESILQHLEMEAVATLPEGTIQKVPLTTTGAGDVSRAMTRTTTKPVAPLLRMRNRDLAQPASTDATITTGRP